MKKKLLYIACIVICLSLITGGTLAYYTATDTARNVITSGGVGVEVMEYQQVGDTWQTYPSQPIAVMPATTVSKIVCACATQQPAWVRMRYSLTVYDADGKKMDISDEELSKVILITPDSTNWTLKDGWWYYGSALKTSQLSKPLFEEVKFSGPDMGNKYQNCTVVVDVITQAVQQANNGNSVMEAIGWPET